MRAFHIILFLIVLQASIVFVSDTGIFNQNYIENASLAKNTYYKSYNITNLSQYNDLNTEPSTWDYFTISARWIIEGFFLFIKIIFAIAFIFPLLISIFNVPTSLAAFIQGGIYVIYLWGYMQWKSGKSTKYME